MPSGLQEVHFLSHPLRSHLTLHVQIDGGVHLISFLKRAAAAGLAIATEPALAGSAT
jgi:hypothetical protein